MEIASSSQTCDTLVACSLSYRPGQRCRCLILTLPTLIIPSYQVTLRSPAACATWTAASLSHSHSSHTYHTCLSGHTSVTRSLSYLDRGAIVPFSLFPHFPHFPPRSHFGRPQPQLPGQRRRVCGQQDRGLTGRCGTVFTPAPPPSCASLWESKSGESQTRNGSGGHTPTLATTRIAPEAKAASGAPNLPVPTCCPGVPSLMP